MLEQRPKDSNEIKRDCSLRVMWGGEGRWAVISWSVISLSDGETETQKGVPLRTLRLINCSVCVRIEFFLLPGGVGKVKELGKSDVEEKTKQNKRKVKKWLNKSRQGVAFGDLCGGTPESFFPCDSLARKPRSSSAFFCPWSSWAALWKARPGRPRRTPVLSRRREGAELASNAGRRLPRCLQLASTLLLPGGELQSGSECMGNKTYQHELL